MLKIYGDTEDNTTYLKLVEREDGFITLIATNNKGEKLSAGILLTIGPDGVITRMNFVNPNIGIRLNKHGKMALQNEIDEEEIKKDKGK